MFSEVAPRTYIALRSLDADLDRFPHVGTRKAYIVQRHADSRVEAHRRNLSSCTRVLHAHRVAPGGPRWEAKIHIRSPFYRLFLISR
jgi:hypothetical protein